ncbi:MAG: TonB-dependent receptor, partial [Spongiibacter sp.]
MKRLALATSCFVLASPVLAQNDDGAPKPRKNRLLEEVVVTAQKREEASTDIPIAIQAFGSGSLDAQNISSTEDLGPLVPSLRFTESAGFTLIYLRGVGTSQFV